MEERKSEWLEFDKAFKLLLKDGFVSYVKNRYNLKFNKIKVLDTELLTDKRFIDFLGEMDTGELLQIDVQSTNDPAMLFRMCEYWGRIIGKYKKAPLQILLYIGKGRSNMHSEMVFWGRTWGFEVINLCDIDAEFFDQINTI